jgi:hypothetical protein
MSRPVEMWTACAGRKVDHLIVVLESAAGPAKPVSALAREA